MCVHYVFVSTAVSSNISCYLLVDICVVLGAYCFFICDRWEQFFSRGVKTLVSLVSHLYSENNECRK